MDVNHEKDRVRLTRDEAVAMGVILPQGVSEYVWPQSVALFVMKLMDRHHLFHEVLSKRPEFIEDEEYMDERLKSAVPLEEMTQKVGSLVTAEQIAGEAELFLREER